MTDSLIQELDRLQNKLEEEAPVRILKIAEAASLEAQDTSKQIGSGFSDLDGCMRGGFREGDLTVISGIAGEGKTTLCRMFTLNFAQAGIPSAWFSHEMTVSELWEEFRLMGANPDLISYVPIELKDDFDWTLKHCDLAIQQHGAKAIFIDTLGDIVRSVKRQQELSNYATYLAQLCKDLRKYAIDRRVMVFVVAHAVKNTKSKSNETENSDIANSAGIAQAAANVFHVWRDNESDNLSYVKVGKSRRDGTKKGWKFKFRYSDHKLLQEGRHLDNPNEDVWRS